MAKKGGGSNVNGGATKLAKFYGDVARRAGNGFANPLLVAILPMVSQLLVGLVQNAKCLKPRVQPDTPQPSTQAALQVRYQASPAATIKDAIPFVRTAVFNAGRAQCKIDGVRYIPRAYQISDDDAKHLAMAHIQGAIGLTPVDAAEIERTVLTQLGQEPVIE